MPQMPITKGGAMLAAMAFPGAYFFDGDVSALKAATEQQRQDVYRTGHLGENEFWLRTDGYLIVDTIETKTASDVCNLIFLSLTLLTNLRPLWPVGQAELEEVTFDPLEGVVTAANRRPVSIRNLFGAFPEFRRRVEADYVTREEWTDVQICQSPLLDLALELAEELHSASRHDAIMISYQAWFNYLRREYSASYLLGWIAIEIVLYKDLLKHLKEMAVYGELANEIEGGWRVVDVLRFLKKEAKARRFVGQGNPARFSLEDLQACDKVRKKRNWIIHRGYYPEKSEADSCHELAQRAMWRLMRLSGIEYNEYWDRKEKLLEL